MSITCNDRAIALDFNLSLYSWGSDAEDFRPERWPGRPFGLECFADLHIVDQFALARARYVLVRFLQR